MSEEDDLTTIRSTIFNVKPYEALLALRNQEMYAAEISKATDTTYSHSVSMLHRFEEQQLVSKNRKGRCTYYSLTTKGKKLAERLKKIESFLVPDSEFESPGPDTGGSLQHCSVSQS